MDAAFIDLTVPASGMARGGTVEDDTALIRERRAIAGRSPVLTSPEATHRFRTGIRFGSGPQG